MGNLLVRDNLPQELYNNHYDTYNLHRNGITNADVVSSHFAFAGHVNSDESAFWVRIENGCRCVQPAVVYGAAHTAGRGHRCRVERA